VCRQLKLPSSPAFRSTERAAEPRLGIGLPLACLRGPTALSDGSVVGVLGGLALLFELVCALLVCRGVSDQSFRDGSRRGRNLVPEVHRHTVLVRHRLHEADIPLQTQAVVDGFLPHRVVLLAVKLLGVAEASTLNHVVLEVHVGLQGVNVGTSLRNLHLGLTSRGWELRLVVCGLDAFGLRSVRQHVTRLLTRSLLGAVFVLRLRIGVLLQLLHGHCSSSPLPQREPAASTTGSLGCFASEVERQDFSMTANAVGWARAKPFRMRTFISASSVRKPTPEPGSWTADSMLLRSPTMSCLTSPTNSSLLPVGVSVLVACLRAPRVQRTGYPRIVSGETPATPSRQIGSPCVLTSPRRKPLNEGWPSHSMRPSSTQSESSTRARALFRSAYSSAPPVAMTLALAV